MIIGVTLGALLGAAAGGSGWPVDVIPAIGGTGSTGVGLGALLGAAVGGREVAGWVGMAGVRLGALLGAAVDGREVAGWVGMAGVRLGALLGASAIPVHETGTVCLAVFARLAKSSKALLSVDGS